MHRSQPPFMSLTIDLLVFRSGSSAVLLTYREISNDEVLTLKLFILLCPQNLRRIYIYIPHTNIFFYTTCNRLKWPDVEVEIEHFLQKQNITTVLSPGICGVKRLLSVITFRYVAESGSLSLHWCSTWKVGTCYKDLSQLSGSRALRSVTTSRSGWNCHNLQK